MKLVIVESPSKAKTIEKYLGKGFTVRASVGHIRDLPKSNKDAVDIENGFAPKYQIVPAKQHVIDELHELSEQATETILATDPDREGEAIAWHLAQAIGLKKPKRIVFHEITEAAVQEALANPRAVDLELVRAQEARRVLDRLFGYDLSGLVWKKVRYGLSAGRVQSPALRIIMEREREIRAFIPEKFWVVSADVRTVSPPAGGEQFTVICSEEPKTEEEASRILKAAETKDWAVLSVDETEAIRSPRGPFTTSTLQQVASTRLGFSPSRTMGVAQKLYEAGHITYMRTDSMNLGADAQKALLAVATKEFGPNYAEARVYKTKSKSAQEAHEAVRPTNPAKASAGANEDQKRLYALIRARALASQMAEAKILRTKVVANVSGASIPDFSANGSRVVFDGWLAADPDARGEDVELPKVKAGEPLDLVKAQMEGKETQPPSRYSEAGLVKELEKRGIGRPSTYASILRTLETRGYVEKQGRTLLPTATGDVVSSFIEENFGEYISDTFTAEMEDELDEIAEGKRKYEKTLKDFYGPFTKAVKSKNKIPKITGMGDAPEEFKCPLCGSDMEYKLSRGGRFMSCKRFPECLGARTEEGGEIAPPTAIGKYPETDEDIYVLTGRFGPYVQVGEVKKGSKTKPRRASIPKEVDPATLSLAQALVYLSLPRVLGIHPESGESVVANVGRFGPYIAHNTKPKADFRSLKTDDVYKVTFERALEILKEEKKKRGFAKKKVAEKTQK
ncbi:MAG: topoisomerase topoisomerase protein [Candidatus Kaiserbacteria bacterium]|nr:topoisomerase topoisomerase protein [Candidatus Kaiserbacteria bacterium]